MDLFMYIHLLVCPKFPVGELSKHKVCSPSTRFLTLPLFFIDYTREMGSIEAAYIGLARYIGEHFHDLNWFPLWYGGIPYPDTYPPLLHFMVAAAAACGRISPGLAYHVVTASIYALGPVTLFWAAWRLGAGRSAAWLAGLGYSLLSPSCWLVRAIRADAGGWFGPRRLGTLVHYGEGPHLTSLLFLPLAVGMVHVALEKRRPIYYVGAALAVAAVVLSNWIGAFALALALSAYLLAGFGKEFCGAGNLARSRLSAGSAFRLRTTWTHSKWLTAAAIGAVCLRDGHALGDSFHDCHHSRQRAPGGRTLRAQPESGSGLRRGSAAAGLGIGAPAPVAAPALRPAVLLWSRLPHAGSLLSPRRALAATRTLPPGDGHGLLAGRGGSSRGSPGDYDSRDRAPTGRVRPDPDGQPAHPAAPATAWRATWKNLSPSSPQWNTRSRTGWAPTCPAGAFSPPAPSASG